MNILHHLGSFRFRNKETIRMFRLRPDKIRQKLSEVKLPMGQLNMIHSYYCVIMFPWYMTYKNKSQNYHANIFLRTIFSHQRHFHLSMYVCLWWDILFSYCIFGQNQRPIWSINSVQLVAFLGNIHQGRGPAPPKNNCMVYKCSFPKGISHLLVI